MAAVSSPPLAWLCAFIFTLSFKPSEPHLTRFLEDVKGFTESDVNNHIYTVWTYAFFPLSVVIAGGLLVAATAPRHSAPALPLVVVLAAGAASRLCTRLLLIFGTTLAHMQLMQVTYAVGSVAEVAFFAFVLVCAPSPADFARVTSFAQHAYIVAHVTSGILGDVLLHGPCLTLVHGACCRVVGAYPVALLLWVCAGAHASLMQLQYVSCISVLVSVCIASGIVVHTASTPPSARPHCVLEHAVEPTRRGTAATTSIVGAVATTVTRWLRFALAQRLFAGFVLWWLCAKYVLLVSWLFGCCRCYCCCGVLICVCCPCCVCVFLMQCRVPNRIRLRVELVQRGVAVAQQRLERLCSRSRYPSQALLSHAPCASSSRPARSRACSCCRHVPQRGDGVGPR
jgi:hypothetical protein